MGSVRIKCKALKTEVAFQGYPSDLMAAFATLPNLLKKLRSQTTDPFFSPIREARAFKARISTLGHVMPQDLENPMLVMDCPGPSSSCASTHYNFSSLPIAAGYNIYWASVIIANSILLRQGEVDSFLVQESQFAANEICKSTNYFQRHKPLGHSTIGSKMTLSVAFGVSSAEQREHIVQGMQELFEPHPPEFWRTSLQFVFDTLTGARDGEIEDWVKL